MDEAMTKDDIEREIEATMRDRGVDRGEAELIVGLKHGEMIGDRLFMRPLTDEQRRRMTMPLHEVMRELGELDDDFELPGESTDVTVPGRGDRVAD